MSCWYLRFRSRWIWQLQERVDFSVYLYLKLRIRKVKQVVIVLKGVLHLAPLYQRNFGQGPLAPLEFLADTPERDRERERGREKLWQNTIKNRSRDRVEGQANSLWVSTDSLPALSLSFFLFPRICVVYSDNASVWDEETIWMCNCAYMWATYLRGQNFWVQRIEENNAEAAKEDGWIKKGTLWTWCRCGFAARGVRIAIEIKALCMLYCTVLYCTVWYYLHMLCTFLWYLRPYALGLRYGNEYKEKTTKFTFFSVYKCFKIF